MKNEKKIRAVIAKLQNVALTRKTLMDNLWVLENEGELLRNELDVLLKDGL